MSTFDAALTWAEGELRAAAEAPAPPPAPALALAPPTLSLTTLTPAQRKRLKRYWIEPRALEPARLTYQAVIYLTHAAIREIGLELSFGERFYDKRAYPTPSEVAKRLNLTTHPVDVERRVQNQYRVTSITTYTQMQSATALAQQLWNTLAPALRTGKIIGATYGVQELETGYRAGIGGYGEWPEPASDRDQDMAAQAFYLTLVHALDVDRAAYPTMSYDLNQDELLEYLHYRRTQAEQLPLSARAESEQWLRNHRHPDLNHYVDPWSRQWQVRQEERDRKYQALVAKSREWLNQHTKKPTRTR